MSTLKKCILLFLRAPEKGRVKTRLAAHLGDEAVLALYRSFVLDILGMLSRTGYPVILFGHPANKIDDIVSWLGPDLPCRPQTGDTLGDKMANAFAAVFSEGYHQALLIGSDIPDLPPRIIHKSFSALDMEGAALGPSIDGGYYLIGFRKTNFAKDVFENISWSTEMVLEETLAKFRKKKIPLRLLEPWQDMDTIEDLSALLARHPSGDSPAPRTLARLRQIEEKLEVAFLLK